MKKASPLSLSLSVWAPLVVCVVPAKRSPSLVLRHSQPGRKHVSYVLIGGPESQLCVFFWPFEATFWEVTGSYEYYLCYSVTVGWLVSGYIQRWWVHPNPTCNQKMELFLPSQTVETETDLACALAPDPLGETCTFFVDLPAHRLNSLRFYRLSNPGRTTDPSNWK